MTRYFLGIEDLSKQGRAEGSIEYRATLGYHGPLIEGDEERVKLIEPEGMTWLNGEPLQIGIRNKPIDRQPLVTNRPIEENPESLNPELLSYDHTQSRPNAKEKIAVYHPINTEGLLEVLLHGELRQIRVTLIAEYFESTGVLWEPVSNVVELNMVDINNQIPSIAA